MSRIGNLPIELPAGVTLSVDAQNKVTVSGPLGKLEQEVNGSYTINQENGVVTITRPNNSKPMKAKHGLYRSLIANMVEGVNKGFKKSLIVNGVGVKADIKGKDLVLKLGFSHPVKVEAMEGVKLEAPSNTELVVSGIDKQVVGQMAAKIRSVKPVEPYHLYGIRYADEVVVKKEGKKAGK